MSAKEKFNAPSLIHFFGTDNFGRDIFSRVLKGSGTTIFIALSTVAIGAAAGTAVGAVTGYFGGFIDEVLSGETADLETLRTLCRNEQLEHTAVRHIGFTPRKG
jgi:ABC-type dipeptide/oligopeptide/nickel transport system permease subunit